MFDHTLKSILAQTSTEFRVIVACHEMPVTRHSADKRVEYIQVESPYPNGLAEQMADKGYKVHAIGKRIRELGGGFTMIVDADDLVSKRLVDFISRHPENKFGWYIDRGYILYLDRKRLNYAPKFPSGSNCIINYTPEMLPDTMDDAWKASSIERPYIIVKGHSLKVKIAECARVGRPLSRLPFRGAVYVLGTGENHSTMNGQRSAVREVMDSLVTRRAITGQFKDEFAVDWL